MTEIIADRIQLLGGPGGDRDRAAGAARTGRGEEGPHAGAPAYGGPEADSQLGPDDDDVPF
jgi:hypothetical protein